MSLLIPVECLNVSLAQSNVYRYCIQQSSIYLAIESIEYKDLQVFGLQLVFSWRVFGPLISSLWSPLT